MNTILHSSARPAICLTGLLCLAATCSLHAQTWDSEGANNNWSTGANWSANVAPVNNSTANVAFGTGARTSPNVDVLWSINQLSYNVGVAAFTIGGQPLTIGAGGIVNTSSNNQTINNNLTVGAAQTWSAGLGNLTIGNAGSLLINNGNLLTIDGSNSTTISSAISGAGGLTKNGAGTFTLGGAGNNNSYSGTTTVNAGLLVLNKTALGTDIAVTGNLVIGDGAGGANVDVVRLDANQQIKNTSGVTLNSSGLFSLNGRFEDIGSLTMNGGTISTGGAGTLQLLGNVTSVSAGTSTPTITGNVDLGGAVRTFTVNSGPQSFDLTIGAAITNGGINKAGLGYLLLSGANSFAGGVTLAAGRLYVGSDTAAGTGTLALNGGTLVGYSLPRTLANPVTLGGDVTVQGADLTLTGQVTLTGDRALFMDSAMTISGNLVQSGGSFDLRKSGPGTLTLTGGVSSNVLNSITVNTGTVLLNKTPGERAADNFIIGDGAGGANADVLRTLAPYQLQFNNSVTLDSSGWLDLNGHNEALTSLTMNGGNITTGAGSIYFNDGGGIATLAGAPSTATISGNVTLSTAFGFSGNYFAVGNGGAAIDLDIPANIDGGGTGLTKSGTGTLRLSGNNSFAGGLYHQAGALGIGSNSGLGAGPLYLQGGSLYTDSGPRTLANPTVLSANTTVASGNLLTLSGPFSVSGTPLLFTSGPVTLSGAVSLPAGNSLTKSGGGTLTISSASTLAGDFTLAAGPLAAANLTIASTGSYTQGIAGSPTVPAPTFDGTLTSKGAFTWNSTGGEFSGRLINEGTTTFNADFFARNGIANFSTLTVGTGRTISTGGAGLDNQGTIVMAGGTLFGSNLNGNSPLDNNGFLTGFGTVTGPVSFTNYGQLNVTGNLTLSTTLSNYNSGNVDVPAGAQLGLTGNALYNSGSLNLAGGSITGTAQILNGTGGTIGGRGQITAPLFNAAGTVVPQTGTLSVPGGINNAGTLLLPAAGTLNVGSTLTNTGSITAAGGTLTGTAAITNSGVIQGAGTITNTITTFTGSRIEPVAGVLTLTGVVNNVAGATISTTTGNKLVISAGLASNAGAFDLAGGTFDNNGHALNNTGSITGYGTLRAGGLTNNGAILFSGGSTSIAGDVVNAVGRTIEVRNTPAFFTGNVTNNGIFKNTDATITFAGNYTENGAYLSDPADNFFANLNVGPQGILSGGHGDRFFIAGNLISYSTRNEAWETRAAELAFDGVSAAFHELSVGGADFGKTDDGYTDNFAWDTVRLAVGEYLTLSDAGEPGGALYTQVFDLGGGLAQLPSVTGNGVNIYYHPARSENAWLHGGSYPLNGGGFLAPVPEPGTAALAALTALTLLRRRRP